MSRDKILHDSWVFSSLGQGFLRSAILNEDEVLLSTLCVFINARKMARTQIDLAPTCQKKPALRATTSFPCWPPYTFCTYSRQIFPAIFILVKSPGLKYGTSAFSRLVLEKVAKFCRTREKMNCEIKPRQQNLEIWSDAQVSPQSTNMMAYPQNVRTKR